MARTVLSGQLAPDPENPAQATYYVNFTVEYLGDQPVSSDTFEMTLIDGVDVAYEPDPQVSQFGAYPPPGGLVAPRNPTSFLVAIECRATYRPDARMGLQAIRYRPVEARFSTDRRPTPTPEPGESRCRSTALR
jgi:hypothetical protein